MGGGGGWGVVVGVPVAQPNMLRWQVTALKKRQNGGRITQKALPVPSS